MFTSWVLFDIGWKKWWRLGAQQAWGLFSKCSGPNFLGVARDTRSLGMLDTFQCLKALSGAGRVSRGLGAFRS